MSDFTSISAVTATLRRLVEAELVGISVSDDHTPAAFSSTSAAVHIYLYRVERHPFTSNFDWQTNAAGRLQAPPFGLTLHYLFTPHGPTQHEIQRTLGELMQALHDRPVLRRGDPVLTPTLADIIEELRVVPHPLPLSELLELWRAFGETAFRLSATYEVSAILIDSTLTRDVQRVSERVIELATSR